MIRIYPHIPRSLLLFVLNNIKQSSLAEWGYSLPGISKLYPGGGIMRFTLNILSLGVLNLKGLSVLPVK